MIKETLIRPKYKSLMVVKEFSKFPINDKKYELRAVLSDDSTITIGTLSDKKSVDILGDVLKELMSESMTTTRTKQYAVDVNE